MTDCSIIEGRDDSSGPEKVLLVNDESHSFSLLALDEIYTCGEFFTCQDPEIRLRKDKKLPDPPTDDRVPGSLCVSQTPSFRLRDAIMDYEDDFEQEPLVILVDEDEISRINSGELPVMFSTRHGMVASRTVRMRAEEGSSVSSSSEQLNRSYYTETDTVRAHAGGRYDSDTDTNRSVCSGVVNKDMIVTVRRNIIPQEYNYTE
jgi:hypothetical protein